MSIPYLGSDKSAACLTRPQYVSRLYCEAGNARLPGSEADILYVYDDGTRQAQKKVVVADSGWWACGEDLPPCETAASRVLVKVKASFV